MGRIRQRDRISAFAGATAMTFAVLAVGGAFRWTQAVVALVVAGALAAQLTSRRQLAGRSPLLILLGIATVFTAIQLIPVPASWVSSLNPTYAELRADGTELAGVETWGSLSMDPASTLRALTMFIILFAGAGVALRLSANETGRHGILAVVASICGLVAFTVGIHEILGAEALFGIYKPSQANPPVLGPLLNPNHLGSLMAVGTVLSIGLFLYHRQSPITRGIWALIGTGCAVVAFASLSRGAVVALLCGVAVTLGIVVAQRLLLRQTASSRPRFLTSSLPIGIVVTCGLILVVFTSAGNVGTQLADTSLQEVHDPRSKFQAWRSAEHLIEESPWVGVGRGAFEPTFTRVHPATAFASISHLENEYIQAVVDWGVPGALILALVLAWTCVVALRRWRDGPLSAAALGALATVAIHSNVDFGVELIGLALPVIAIAATLTYTPMTDNRTVGFALVPRALVIVAVIASAVVLLTPHTSSVGEDHEVLADRDFVTEEAILDAIRRHPLDYIAYATYAERELRDRPGPQAIRLLNHALQLHPTHAGLHRIAGRVLYRSGRPQQAAIEYAAALRGTVTPQGLLDEIVTTLKPEDAVMALPLDYRNLEVILRALGHRGATDVSIAYLDRVLVVRPRELAAANELFRLAMTRGKHEVAERAARIMVRLEPSSKSRAQLAKVLYARGKFADVVKLVEDVGTWRGRVGDIVEGWLLLCNSRAEKSIDDGVRCFHFMEAQAPIGIETQRVIRVRLEELRQRRAVDADFSGMLPALVDPERWGPGL